MATNHGKFILIFFVIFLAGCGTAGSTTAVGKSPQQIAADANATLSAVQIGGDLTRQAEAQRAADAANAVAATAQAHEMKIAAEQAEAQRIAADATIDAQRAADAALAMAQATESSLMVEQTAVALQISIDESTRVAAEAGAILAVTIEAEQARELQRLKNVEMLRAAEAQRLRSAQIWKQIFNLGFFGLMLALIAMLILIGIAIFNRLKSLNENPVQQFKDPDQHVTILVAPDGLFGTQVRQIGNPRRGPIDITPEPLALPAPLRELSPIPIGHVLIAGGSGSGKSTAMRAIIEKRRGEVLVIDPHAAPNEWNASRVIGMEGNFDAIAEFFGWMQNELARRTGLRGRGEQMDFPELTVATDELPAIVTKLGKREATAAWIDWIEQGRKFGLFAMLSSQSTSVRSMGIDGKGDLRKQFSAVVSLGSEAERRFPEIAQGMTRPAVVELEGRQARPVIIPNVPAFASAGANGYANGSAVVVDQPIINQKPDPDRPAGMSTEKGFIPEDEVKRILHYGRTLPSLRQVATAVYNQTGGVGFYKTQAVLNRYGVTPGQA